MTCDHKIQTGGHIYVKQFIHGECILIVQTQVTYGRGGNLNAFLKVPQLWVNNSITNSWSLCYTEFGSQGITYDWCSFNVQFITTLSRLLPLLLHPTLKLLSSHRTNSLTISLKPHDVSFEKNTIVQVIYEMRKLSYILARHCSLPLLLEEPLVRCQNLLW